MFNSILSDGLNVTNVIICVAVSMAAGVAIAFTYKFKSPHSQNFVLTLIFLPVIVQAVIMMVNGNIGTGVAVMGAFSLVRFRSLPGSSKDILFIFFAMAVGIATGIGQIYFAIALCGVVCLSIVAIKSMQPKSGSALKTLKITVPDSVDYEHDLNDLLKARTKKYDLVKIKTQNMGSLFVLEYEIVLKAECNERLFIDEIRTINSNLPVVLGISRQGEEL